MPIYHSQWTAPPNTQSPTVVAVSEITGQTGKLQQQGGQKASPRTVTAAPGTPVVQISPGQTKTQCVEIGGKQTITRKATKGEMLIVKRQPITSQQHQQQNRRGVH